MSTEYFRNRNKNATGQVMRPGLNYLSDLIVRPGIEKRLWPLCLYRGRVSPGAAHRMWNFALLMMAAEAPTLKDGLRLSNNPAFSQLCGPLRTPSLQTLYTFFGRLWDSNDVTDNIPGFSEYVKSLQLGPSLLRPVPLETEREFCAPWRISLHPEAGQREKPFPGERGAPVTFYPYVIHDHAKPEGHDLVAVVNEAVPHGLPEAIRADVCQDLILGILEGRIKRENVRDHVHRMIGKTFGDTEWKWMKDGAVRWSFDGPLTNSPDEDRTLADVLHDGSFRYSADEMEDDNEQFTQ